MTAPINVTACTQSSNCPGIRELPSGDFAVTGDWQGMEGVHEGGVETSVVVPAAVMLAFVEQVLVAGDVHVLSDRWRSLLAERDEWRGLYEEAAAQRSRLLDVIALLRVDVANATPDHDALADMGEQLLAFIAGLGDELARLANAGVDYAANVDSYAAVLSQGRREAYRHAARLAREPEPRWRPTGGLSAMETPSQASVVHGDPDTPGTSSAALSAPETRFVQPDGRVSEFDLHNGPCDCQRQQRYGDGPWLAAGGWVHADAGPHLDGGCTFRLPTREQVEKSAHTPWPETRAAGMASPDAQAGYEAAAAEYRDGRVELRRRTPAESRAYLEAHRAEQIAAGMPPEVIDALIEATYGEEPTA